MDKLFYYLTDLSGGVAYAIVFGILVACGLGFPLPEDIPLIATGYLVWDETMSWAPAIAVTMGGVLIGDTILFFLGRRLGMRILHGERPPSFLNPDKIRRTRAYIRKYGDKIVFIARFVAGFRAVAFFMAGAMKMPYSRFIWLDGLAALLSVPLWIGIGYGLGHMFGDEISAILHSVKHVKNIVTVVILTIVGAILVRMVIKWQQAKRAEQKRAAARAQS